MGSFYYVYILRDVTTGMHHFTGAVFSERQPKMKHRLQGDKKATPSPPRLRRDRLQAIDGYLGQTIV